MKKRNAIFHDVSTKLFKLVNLMLMMVPFAVIWYSAYADLLWVKFWKRGHWLVLLLFVILYFIIGRIYDAFRISYTSKGEIIYSQMLSLFEADVMMYIVAWLLIRDLPAVLPMLAVFSMQGVVSVIWTYIAQKWYFSVFPADKTLIVWDLREDISDLIEKYKLKKKYNVVATVNVSECISNIEMLENADTVFLVGIHSHERNSIAKYCMLHDITAFVIPRVGDLILASARRRHLLYLPILKIDRRNLSLEYLAIKRIGDIALSLIGLIVLSPVFLVTAICIKAEDGGPVFYKQVRLTKDGKKFEIIKFRSMRTDAEKDGVARLSSGEDDDRITKTGRIIRKTRIDELPNLINIFRGDLSIVGPRAERPELAEEYQKELPEFALRLQIKAGLTGYAQVYGKYNTLPYDKLLMDLMYIANASVFEDLRIIFATVKILFMSESTEGVEAGKTMAMNYENDVFCSNAAENGESKENHDEIYTDPGK